MPLAPYENTPPGRCLPGGTAPGGTTSDSSPPPPPLAFGVTVGRACSAGGGHTRRPLWRPASDQNRPPGRCLPGETAPGRTTSDEFILSRRIPPDPLPRVWRSLAVGESRNRGRRRRRIPALQTPRRLGQSGGARRPRLTEERERLAGRRRAPAERTRIGGARRRGRDSNPRGSS